MPYDLLAYPIAIAVQMDIIDGTQKQFRPNDPCSRQDLVAMLSKMADWCKKNDYDALG